MSSPRVGCLAVHCHAIRCDANRGGSGDRGAQPGRPTRSGTGRSGAAAIGDESSTIAKANWSDPAPAAMPPASRSVGVAARPARGSAGRDAAPCGLPQMRARRPDAIGLVKGSLALRLTALGCRRESELLLIRNRRTKFATESKKKSRATGRGRSGRRAGDRDHAVCEAGSHMAAFRDGQARERCISHHRCIKIERFALHQVQSDLGRGKRHRPAAAAVVADGRRVARLPSTSPVRPPPAGCRRRPSGTGVPRGWSGRAAAPAAADGPPSCS